MENVKTKSKKVVVFCFALWIVTSVLLIGRGIQEIRKIELEIRMITPRQVSYSIDSDVVSDSTNASNTNTDSTSGDNNRVTQYISRLKHKEQILYALLVCVVIYMTIGVVLFMKISKEKTKELIYLLLTIINTIVCLC